MTACTATIRRALHTITDALADFIEVEAARPAAAPQASNDSHTAEPEPNPEVAEAFARRDLHRLGVPVPPRRREVG